MLEFTMYGGTLWRGSKAAIRLKSVSERVFV